VTGVQLAPPSMVYSTEAIVKAVLSAVPVK
jgi:hypothetical protein